MAWRQRTKLVLKRFLTSLLTTLLIGLVFGVAFSWWLIPKPSIAVLNISGVMSGQEFVDSTLELIQQARSDRNIRAVVLKIDSPGGSVSAVEPIYLELLKLREAKPVVVSVGTVAASGGYYIAAPANYIYAEPTSTIGSVGVKVTLPEVETLDETTLTTGPFKSTGGSQRKVVGVLATAQKQFTSAVTSGRGAKLKLSTEELARGEIYSGTEGLRNGLIDEIGTSLAAREKAASLAHIRNYRVTNLENETASLSWLFESDAARALLSERPLIPTYYYLYVEPE
ncbi:MAG: S49 family peptidase [Chloroflexota bacterium]